MRLGGMIAAAIEILMDMEARHRPASEALKDWGVSHRFAGSGDRAAIGNLVHDALRRRRSGAFLMGGEGPRAAVIGALVLEIGYSADGLAKAFSGDRFAPEPLSERELTAIRDNDPAAAPDAVRADCPDWAAAYLHRAFGEAWIDEAAALAKRPPLDLRVNTLKAERAKVLNALGRSKASPTPIAAHGIRIPPIEGEGRHPNVRAEPAFRKGWFEVQDEGSQVAAELAGAQSGMQVLDLCAGAGGKTLAMSAAMENRGQIHAHDADRQRLAPIFERLKSAGCRNVQVVADTSALAALEGQMDLVLVDAPCSGSGTWRRRPDAKWRLTERQVEARVAEQSALLEAARGYVKPGGRLAYVTCSVFREENHERVAAFLEHAPDFQAFDHAALWTERYAGTEYAGRVESASGITLTPARSGTDGFFIACLRRGS